MKSRILMLAVVAAAAAVTPSTTSAQIQAQFEGTVKGTMSADGMDVEMVQHMKGSMMRLDMHLASEDMDVTQIMDVASGKTLMILHDEKMWMDMAMMSQFMPGAAPQAASSVEVELPEIRKMGEVDDIAGYECEWYTLVMDEHEVTVCATGGLGCFIPGAPAGLDRGRDESIPKLPQSAALWLEEFGDGFFILRMEADGASYIVEELEPGSPSDELFTPPADYTEMKIPGR